MLLVLVGIVLGLGVERGACPAAAPGGPRLAPGPGRARSRTWGTVPAPGAPPDRGAPAALSAAGSGLAMCTRIAIIVRIITRQARPAGAGRRRRARVAWRWTPMPSARRRCSPRTQCALQTPAAGVSGTGAAVFPRRWGKARRGEAPMPLARNSGARWRGRPRWRRGIESPILFPRGQAADPAIAGAPGDGLGRTGVAPLRASITTARGYPRKSRKNILV